MAEFEDEETFENQEFKTQNSLDRKSPLHSSTPKKSFGILGLILMGAAVVLLFFLFSGKEKQKEGIQKESVEFEPAFKKQVILPEAPPPLSFKDSSLPSEADLDRAKKEEVLRQARLKSAILVYGGNGGSAAPASSPEENSSTSSSSLASQDPNSKFQEGVESSTTPKVKASSLGSLSQTILQGKLIDGVLETAIHSDLPGMVRAMVSHDVYAESGNQILIPKGSRLIGQYNSEQVKGQSRVFVIWSRLVRPDGIEVALNSPGTDPLGQAGVTGKVNNHFWKIFGNSLLLSLIGAGAANAGVDTTDQANSMAAYREQAAEAFQNSSARILEDAINIQPTIHVKQGTKIKVFVAKDLDFSQALSSLKNSVMIP